MALEDVGLEEGNISESVSDVSEADLQRVRNDAKKAKQVRAQIQKVQKQNRKLATMLSLLLQYIDDEKLLGYVFQQLIDYHVAIPAIFAQFLPFLQNRIETDIYKNMYGALWEKLPQEESLVNLVKWLKTVRASSQSLQAIDLVEYTHFVIRYLHRYKLVDRDAMDEKQRGELHTEVKGAL